MLSGRRWELLGLAVAVILVVVAFYLTSLPYTASHVVAACLLVVAFGVLLWLAWCLPDASKPKRAVALVVVVLLWLGAEAFPVYWLWTGPTPTPLVRLHYGDDELYEGRRITLERGCDKAACRRMHLWPASDPTQVGLYGIWIEKPLRVPPFGTNGTVAVEFSESATETNRQCDDGGRPPHPGYKVSLICRGQPQPRGDIWELPHFYFAPVAKGPLHVRVVLDYGEVVSSPAEFTLLPPTE